MPRSRFTVWLLSIGGLVLGTGVAGAQNFPDKPVRIVAPVIGGTTDILARLIAQGITGGLGQPVIIDNRPSTQMGAIVAGAPPDGYTLLFSAPFIWITPLLSKTPYDPVKDFAPVTLAAVAPNLVIVHPSLPVKVIKELIALAKARPGQLNYSAVAIGSSSHLAAELFNYMAGVRILHIPFKGTAEALNALISGEVQVNFASGGGLAPYVKSGRLRALAVTSSRPSEQYPELPTVASSLPGYESMSTQAMFAPAKTPAAVIGLLNREIVRFLKTAETKDRFLRVGAEVVGSSPEELAAAVKSEMTSIGKVIKEAGIRID